MKHFILTICVLLMPLTFMAQYNSGGQPISSLINLDKNYQMVSMPSFDVEAMKQEDYINANKIGVPYRYGKVFEVNYNLSNSGTWTRLQDGSRVWRLAIKSENAISINLFYKEFFMPTGGLFYIYNPEKEQILGAFTELNNASNKYFSTAPTLGDITVLEYYEPSHSIGKGKINISQVVHAYKDIFGYLSPEELACNININCPIGAPWVEQKRSVTRITFVQGGGGYLCSGSLVNNVLQDRKLYYLTAEHCAPDNHASMVFFFNYENPTCWGTGGSMNQTLSGATLRAANYATDFRLVEINGSLPASYNGYFNGWDRSNAQPQNETAIHHPGGANKKISVDIHPAVTSNGFGGRLVNGFWLVIWDYGMTEGGSSGCPLYDQNKRVIGQNLGGTASQCENPQAVLKYFGKFSSSWDYGGSSNNQLKNWLDPNNTNPNTLDGINALTGQAPVANFTSDTTILPIGGGNINFFDLSIYEPTSWSWSFPGGNPSTSNVKNPTNINYSQTGYYTVTLTATNAAGSNTFTFVNYIKVNGVPLSAFNLISPPNFSLVNVSNLDTSRTHFNWTKASTSNTVRYTFRIRKIATTVDYLFASNNNGMDSVASIRNNQLDSIAFLMGLTGDSVRCSWRVSATNGADTILSPSFIITLKTSTIGINPISTEIPNAFVLYNNYPNPFNPITKINFDLPKQSYVKIKVYNAVGKLVKTITESNLYAGKYSVDFDGSNLASGVYFYSLETPEFYQVRKMVLLK